MILLKNSLRIGIVLCGMMLVNTLSAQSLMKGWEVGPWGGVSYYFGDLNTNFRLNHTNAAGGMLIRYNFNDRLAFSLSGNYGQIEAYDSDSQNPFERNRNLSFKSDIWDGSALFEFNFLPYIHGSRDHYFSPYLFGGLSVFKFQPMAQYDGPNISASTGSARTGDWVSLRELGTEGQFKGEEYFAVTAAFTYGMGFKFDLSYEWSVNIHIGVRSTYTDYLDDVSTVYPDASDLAKSRGELAAYMSNRTLELNGDIPSFNQENRQRGDDSKNDIYLFAGVGFLYYFGDVRCPSYGSGTRR